MFVLALEWITESALRPVLFLSRCVRLNIERRHPLFSRCL
jgi:hypothetical protein